MNISSREGPREFIAPDDTWKSIDPLEHSFPDIDVKRLCRKIHLFLKSVSDACDRNVLGFRSEIEFDTDGLIVWGTT